MNLMFPLIAVICLLYAPLPEQEGFFVLLAFSTEHSRSQVTPNINFAKVSSILGIGVKFIKCRAAPSNSMHLPISTPSAPAAMRLDSCPNQDEANNEIDAWLSSGLQSYVEEGQRMRDAADGIPSTKTLAVTRTTTHAVDRYEGRYLPPSPEPSAANTHEQCRDNHADVPPRVPDLLNNALSERPIIIKGNNHNIYINYGTGQQNINYSGPRGDRNNNDEEGDEDDGYNTDGDSGDAQDNVQEYDSGDHQPGYSHDGRDDGYGGHTRRRDVTSYERQGSQPDLASADGSCFDEYSD